MSKTKRRGKILITGGMGFIGTAMVKHFCGTHEVVVADRLDFGLSGDLVPLLDQGEIEFVKTDLSNPGSLFGRIVDGEFRQIVHLASLTHIPLCEQFPEVAYRSNVISALNILKTIPASTRLINFSTSSTYAPEMKAHNEDKSKLAPVDFYGMAKLHVEDLAAYYATKRKLNILHVRLANAVGRGETNVKLLGSILVQIKEGKRTIELGNLTPRRDFIHVDDIAWVVDQLFRKWPVVAGKPEVFNVGTGRKAVSVRELFDAINDCVGGCLRVKSVASRRRKKTEERELLVPNPTKLKKLLPNYRPKKMGDWLPGVVENPALRISNRLEKTVRKLARQ